MFHSQLIRCCPRALQNPCISKLIQQKSIQSRAHYLLNGKIAQHLFEL